MEKKEIHEKRLLSLESEEKAHIEKAAEMEQTKQIAGGQETEQRQKIEKLPE